MDDDHVFAFIAISAVAGIALGLSVVLTVALLDVNDRMVTMAARHYWEMEAMKKSFAELDRSVNLRFDAEAHK